jgi:uncharacterized protein
MIQSASSPVCATIRPDSFKRSYPLRRLVERPRLPAFAAADFEPPLRTRLLILQPTPFCNINCSYCYLPDRNSRDRMETATAYIAARRLADDGLLGDDLTIVWHAGEPLVLPPAYYEDAFAAIKDALGADCDISHSIQTNATLIDDAWCDFFLKHAVKVGVSVDGPEQLHDRSRRTRSGRGTHAKVMRGLAALRRAGIPHHAIAVVTEESLEQADAIHAFFCAQEIHDVGFNFDEAEGVHHTSSIADHEEAHRAFIERMLDHMMESRGQYQVRELACMFRLIAEGVSTYRFRGRSLPENGQTMPFALVSVACNGDFSTFSPELLGQRNQHFANFVLGNVHAVGYYEAARGEAFAKLWEVVQRGVAACESTCAYFDYCGGGAPANKLYENGSIDSAETLYCRSMIQRPFEAALSKIEDSGV